MNKTVSVLLIVTTVVMVIWGMVYYVVRKDITEEYQVTIRANY